MLFSQKTLQRILGALWLADGILQLQPQMFTMNMVNGVMKPMLEGQPGVLEPSLQFIVNQTTAHLTAMNLLIAIVQILLGVGFLVLPNRRIKPVVILSIIWSLIVWYGGEGLSMLLTGQASILTGAPGAVMLYPLLGLAIYPRQQPAGAPKRAPAEGLISRLTLRWILSGFWIFSALLQLQPFWWQTGQISGTISDMTGQGGLNALLVDPVLQPLANVTANIEIPLNIILIVVCLALGIGLAVARENQLRPFLIASVVVSVIIWYFAQGLGMIMTGMATDFNSGLLLVVITLACWPKERGLRVTRARVADELRQMEADDTDPKASSTAQTQNV